MNHGTKLMSGVAISGAIGLAVSAAWTPAVVVSIAGPALWIRQPSARFCFYCTLAYYLMALRSLPIVARNFFGPHAGFLEGLGLWIVASGLLALPWRWLWFKSAKAALWRVPLALLISIVPPLGLIGWASPTVAAGLLFPATGYIGFAITVCLPGCLAVAPKRTLSAAATLAVVCNGLHPEPPNVPSDWQGVNTNYGAVAHDRLDLLREYQIAEDVQSRSLALPARVIVFPESVIPHWTLATEIFWEHTITALKRDGKTVLFGAIIPATNGPVESRWAHDLTASVAALQNTTAITGESRGRSERGSQGSYTNGVVIRGAETGSFAQRVPVPLGMWRPFTNTGTPLRLAGPSVVSIGDDTAAIIICYEQLIPWPVLTSFLERPSIIVAVANNFWVSGTPIPRVQQSTMRAWARLFHSPVIFAVNS
jgi:apolipoprotein N-acyltransferase